VGLLGGFLAVFVCIYQKKFLGIWSRVSTLIVTHSAGRTL